MRNKLTKVLLFYSEYSKALQKTLGLGVKVMNLIELVKPRGSCVQSLIAIRSVVPEIS